MVKLRGRLRAVLLMAMIMGLPWFPVAWADLDDGLVAYYPFNGNANDASGNGNDGTVNGATLTEDRSDNADSAYNFDGTDDYIKINKNVLFEVSSLTISAWVKWKGSTPSDHHAIVSNYSGYQNASDELQHYGLRIAKQSKFSEFFYDDGSQWDDVNGNSNIGDGEWHFIAGILNSGVDAKIYVDGQLENTDIDSIPTSILPSGDLYIGRDGTAEAELRWNGAIDDVRIYNRALSECEIKSLYTGKDECESNLIELANFTATPIQNDIRLDWETTSEVNTAGFFIWRGTPLANGKCTNNASNYKDILQMSFDNARGDLSSGATYSRTDSNVTSGSYCYLLEEVEFDGDRQFHWD
ncbi:MAG: LamG domain-containing protein, partial [Thiomargarita sp.]|nr:LamG domain-containing protein [Thiomargarita sp.]